MHSFLLESDSGHEEDCFAGLNLFFSQPLDDPNTLTAEFIQAEVNKVVPVKNVGSISLSLLYWNSSKDESARYSYSSQTWKFAKRLKLIWTSLVLAILK